MLVKTYEVKRYICYYCGKEYKNIEDCQQHECKCSQNSKYELIYHKCDKGCKDYNSIMCDLNEHCDGYYTYKDKLTDKEYYSALYGIAGEEYTYDRK